MKLIGYSTLKVLAHSETEQVVFRNRCHNSVIPNLYLASYIDLAFDRDSFKHRKKILKRKFQF